MEVNRGRGITFQVATEASTRATATTTGTIDEFTVWGFTTENGENKTLMDTLAVTKTGETWGYTGTIYWPANPVDFYSVSPTPVSGKVSDGTVSIANNAQTISDFTANTDQSKQVDLLYAVNKGEKKADHTASAVSINFRHALSQIVFRAKNTNENLTVTIRGVKVGNIKKTGDFTYPTSSTTTQNTSETGTITASTQGTWGNVETEVTFAAGVTPQTLAGVKEAVDLTTKTGTAYSGALFMIPQKLTAWDPETIGALSPTNKGVYFLVDCQMLSGEDDVTVWPTAEMDTDNDGYAEVAIPASDLTWEQGKKYIYTFVFGKGGGYEPGTDPDPDPTLYGIDFTVTVDEFINGFAPDDDKEVDMTTDEE